MYKVGIIGLGNIASRYSKPSDPYPYCHVGGIRLCNSTELVAVADISEERRKEFKETWEPAFPENSIRYYEDSSKMMQEEQLDIVAICVRGPDHYKVTMDVINSGNTKLIFLEKPMGCSLSEIDEMTKAAEEKNIPIIVDYSRHWAPHLLKLQELVRNGLIGDVQSVVGYCGGGVLSFAIHTTDLICQFAGYEPLSVAGFVEPSQASVPEGYEPEPGIIGAIIKFKNGITGYHVGRHGSITGFTVDVLGTEGSLRAGMYVNTTLYDKKGQQVDVRSLNLPRNESVFKIAYEQICAYLDGGSLPDCAKDQYMAVNEIGFATIESGLTGQMVNIPCEKRNRLIFANG